MKRTARNQVHRLNFRFDAEGRNDAQTNIFLARELEHVDPTDYYTLFAGLRARRFIPKIEGVPDTAETYSYKMITFTGQAIDGAPGRGATEALRAGVTVDEKKQAIEEIPVTFGWTMREIEQAAARNVPLDRWTIQSAMTAVARKIDHRLAFGVAGTTMTGLLNHASTQASTATTKTGGQIEWTAATPGTEMLADINKLVADLHSSLLQASLLPGGESIPAFERVTVLMPTFHYGLAMETPRTTTSDTTVLDYALAHNKWIESIEEWNACDIASAVGGTPGTTGAAMMFAYAKDPLAVGALIPNDWKQRAPQEKGHNIEIPAVGLCGGTVIRYAMATRKMNLTD